MSTWIHGEKIFQHPERLSTWVNSSERPVTVDIHLTNHCNNRCLYCMCSGVERSVQMSDGQAQRAVQVAVEVLGAKGIVFSGGGEPTLSPCFDASVLQAKNFRADVGVVTNGTQWGRGRIRRLIQALSWVRVSLDASTSDEYRAVRQSGHFNSVVESLTEMIQIRDWLGTGTTVGVQFVAGRASIHRVEAFIEFCEAWLPGIDYVQIRPDAHDMGTLPEWAPEPLASAEKRAAESPLNVIFSERWHNGSERGFSACHASRLIGCIDAKGDYYTCCHVIGSERHRMFNISDEGELLDRLRERSAEAGPLRGLDTSICPVDCRGGQINRSLERFTRTVHHINFL